MTCSCTAGRLHHWQYLLASQEDGVQVVWSFRGVLSSNASPNAYTPEMHIQSVLMVPAQTQVDSVISAHHMCYLWFCRPWFHSASVVARCVPPPPPSSGALATEQGQRSHCSTQSPSPGWRTLAHSQNQLTHKTVMRHYVTIMSVTSCVSVMLLSCLPRGYASCTYLSFVCHVTVMCRSCDLRTFISRALKGSVNCPCLRPFGSKNTMS